VYLVHSERRRHSHAWARASRALALFVAVLSLFPCVSASDDSVRFEYLGASHSTPVKPSSAPDQTRPTPISPEKSHVILVRLLESLESVQVPLIWALSVTLCFFALVLVEWRISIDRMVPNNAGRDPPSFVLA